MHDMLPSRLKANSAQTQHFEKKVPAMIFSGTFQLSRPAAPDYSTFTPRLTTTGCKVVGIAEDRYAFLM